MGCRESEEPWNIFLVDDEPSVCKALSQTLTEHSCRVRSFTRAEECLTAMREESCDLLITGYGEVPMAVKAIKAGACDFIEKPLDEETFLPAVQAVLEQSAGDKSPEGGVLTAAEKRILNFIMDGKGNKEIAYILGCSTRTVENHRYRMMHKLKVSSTAELVKYALTQGLLGAVSAGFLNFGF